jgi:hypothetical protein
MYPSINIQGQQLPRMLPNQITPLVQAPMLPLQADKNNYGLSEYSMTCGEEELHMDTDKHPWQNVKIKGKHARDTMQLM